VVRWLSAQKILIPTFEACQKERLVLKQIRSDFQSLVGVMSHQEVYRTRGVSEVSERYSVESVVVSVCQ
jgi:hypothetical protein